MASPAWAINKCTQKDGKVVYQDAQCDNASTRSERVTVTIDSSQPTAVPSTPKSATTGERATQSRAEAPGLAGAAGMGPNTTDLSNLDQLAARCLDWYRPLLRDPVGAYFAGPSFVSGTLTMTVYGRNGFGGYVPKRAACEFKAGRVDHDWTKIQAKRAGWN